MSRPSAAPVMQQLSAPSPQTQGTAGVVIFSYKIMSLLSCNKILDTFKHQSRFETLKMEMKEKD